MTKVEPRWYGPEEQWPTHDKPWWAEALREARQAGWHLRTFAGHTWGKVVCDRDATDAHQMLIFSTGRGGENSARQLQRLIKRCQHNDPDGAADLAASQRATQLLDGASLLLDAAELLVRASDKRARAEELLALAEQQLTRIEVADALLTEAVNRDRDADGDTRVALQLAAEARYPSRAPVTPTAITDEAEERVDTAHAASSSQAISDRITALRERITRIRAIP